MPHPVPSKVLVDQTTLCEASRLLERPPEAPWSTRAAEQLVHLSMLLDTLLLYDELHVLNARLPGDADALPLRRVLLDRGILRSVDTRPLATRVGDELAGFLAGGSLAPGGSLSRWHPARQAGDGVRAWLDHQPTGDDRRDLVRAMRREYESGAGYRYSAAELRADPLRALRGVILSRIDYWYSGAATEAVSHLRTFVYWRAAAQLRTAFIPSLYRLPAYHLMTDHVRRTVQHQVYGVVSDLFHATVSEVYADEEPLPVYLPPALSLFLDHLRRHGDVAAAVDDLRARHRKLRRALARFQDTLDAGSSLGEARDARRRLAATLDALREDLGPGLPGASGTIDRVLDIVPGVAAAAANPLDVAGFTDALVRRPRDWLRSWWLRRPVRAALTLSSRLDDLGRYDQLLAEAVGLRCDPAVNEALRSSYARTLGVYGGESRLPGPPQRPPAGPQGTDLDPLTSN